MTVMHKPIEDILAMRESWEIDDLDGKSGALRIVSFKAHVRPRVVQERFRQAGTPAVTETGNRLRMPAADRIGISQHHYLKRAGSPQ